MIRFADRASASLAGPNGERRSADALDAAFDPVTGHDRANHRTTRLDHVRMVVATNE
jgi:hypothetical protein